MFVRVLVVNMLLTACAHAAEIPLFRNYPADIVAVGPGAPVDLSSPNAYNYRTRLREAAAGRVNFAGHYKLTTWGCGTQCETGAMVDALTGQVTFLPFTICCEDWPIDSGFKRILFRKNSRLIVFSGLLNEEGTNGVHFYEFRDGRFERVSTRIPPNSEAAMKAEQDRANEARRRAAESIEAEARAQRAQQDRDAAEANRKRAELELQATKAKRLEDAEGVLRLAKEALYSCTDKQLQDLVASGETASVLASAAINFCNAPFENALRAFKEVAALRDDKPINSLDNVVMSAALKDVVKEAVTAQAVKVKAAVKH